MVTATKVAKPTITLEQAIDALRPHITAEFVADWKRFGRQVGYRNLARAIAELKPAVVVADVAKVTPIARKTAKPAAVKVVKARDWTLSDALGIAGRVVAKRMPLPILCNVLIEPIDNGRVRIVASDLEAWIVTEAAASWDGPGLCVEPKALMAAVKSNPDASYKVSGHTLEVIGDKGTTSMHGLDAADFPPPPAGELADFVSIDGLRDKLTFASYAAATDESRPVLTGIRIGNTGTVAASDGFRLRIVGDVKDIASDDCIVLPAKRHALVPADVSTIKVNAAKTFAHFVGEHYSLIAQLIQGSFPNFASLVPTEWATTATVARVDLENAFTAVSEVAKDGAGIVRLSAVDSTMVVSSHSENLGYVNADVPCSLEVTPGIAEPLDQFKLAFNLNYLKAMTRTAGDVITIRSNGASAQTMFTSHDDRLEVIMPMFVQW